MNSFPLIAKKTERRTAFTLVELLVILAVLAVLGCMLLPAFARTRTASTSTQCRNNLKQLAAAWSMYSAEHNGRLVSSYPNYAGFSGSWCAGNAATGGGVTYGYGGRRSWRNYQRAPVAIHSSTLRL
jgi:Tfp pilus assembly protein FimT